MLKSERMVKVVVAGPKPYMDSVINKLYDLSFFHIIDYQKKSEDDFFDIGSPFEENEMYSSLLVKIRALKAYLGVTKTASSRKTELGVKEIQKTVDTIYDRTRDIQEVLKYTDKVIKIHESNEQIKALESLTFDPTDKKVDKYVHFIGFVKGDIEEEVSKLTQKYVLYQNTYKDTRVVALFVEPKAKDKVASLLEQHSFSPIEKPFISTQFGEMESKNAIQFIKLGYELDKLRGRKKKVLKELESIKAEYEDFLINSDRILSDNVNVAEAPLRFATTKNTFLIKGWAPESKMHLLQKEIGKVAKDKVYIHSEKPKKHEEVPIEFNNPKVVQPFEFFMNLYSLPNYREIDPTFFLALTFPLFFGMMLGDVGYGLVTLALFWFLKSKMPKAHVLNAFMIASIASIVFGVMFGEYFGLEIFPQALNGIGRTLCDGYNLCAREIVDGKVVYEIPHLLARSHQIQDLMSVALLVGIFHMALGLIIGFANIYKHHGLKHAITEKAGWLLILPAMVWILVDFLGVITGFTADLIKVVLPSTPIVFAMFGIGAVLVVIGEGVRGAIEVLFMSLLSNILSYARLMAVGLASVGLAAVVNDLAGQLFSAGFFGIIMGIFVLVLGHTINIMLGILSPFLHGIRLHYVEFFGKFFHGGGFKFNAFGRKD